jgi:hypothetical protein
MIMKKRPFVLTTILTLLIFSAVGLGLINSAGANMVPYEKLPEITIGSDGSISPETGLISRNGNNYTLTADVQEYPIVIECSNIVFDGAGHTIKITTGDNPGLELSQVNNVIVKNLRVSCRNYYTVTLQYSSNCLITGVQIQTGNHVRLIGDNNTITKSTLGVCIFRGSNNTIVKNNVNILSVFGYNNNFSLNNFLLNDYASIYYENIWVGNYWSNYSITHPNAVMIDNSGIGDTPYVIERDFHSTKEYPDAINIDHYPLMRPIDINNNTIRFSYPALTSGPEPTSISNPDFGFYTGLALVIFFVALFAGLMVYFKKRKH